MKAVERRGTKKYGLLTLYVEGIRIRKEKKKQKEKKTEKEHMLKLLLLYLTRSG